MAMSSKADYISKGIVLHRDTWAALNALRKAQGINGKLASYNTVLKSWLCADGPTATFPPMAKGQCHWESGGKIVGPTVGCKHGSVTRKREPKERK